MHLSIALAAILTSHFYLSRMEHHNNAMLGNDKETSFFLRGNQQGRAIDTKKSGAMRKKLGAL